MLLISAESEDEKKSHLFRDTTYDKKYISGLYTMFKLV
jgi:hypothetical protein